MVSNIDDYREKRAVQDTVPPQSVEAEESILAGILLDPNAIERITGVLVPEAFYMKGHQEIYRAMVQLHALNMPTDMITVTQVLSDRKTLEQCGGKNKLVNLLDRVVSAANIDVFAELVMQKYRQRLLIQYCQDAIAQSYANADWNKTLSEIEQRVFSLSAAGGQKGIKPLGDFLTEEFQRIEKITTEGTEPGLTCGFYDIDAMTQGFQCSDLVVVAGRPGSGKTSLMTAIAANMARIHDLPIVIFSLEMSGGQLGRRLLSKESRIEYGRITAGKISQQEWEPLGTATSKLSFLPIWIDDSQSITPNTIRSQCRKLKAQHGGMGCIIVDYLHLMLDGGDDDVKELGRISRGMKRLAMELEVPVILLSQLNRGVESRTDKRPTMSDLRASGRIEEDADMILLLYRDSYYNPNSNDQGVAEVIFAKHRNGPTGTVKLLFEERFTEFRNMAKRD